MTVERITVPAISFIEAGLPRTLAVMRDPSDSTWWVLDESSCSYYESADAVRRFAQNWLDDPEFDEDCREAVDAYFALADLIAELEAAL